MEFEIALPPSSGTTPRLAGGGRKLQAEPLVEFVDKNGRSYVEPLMPWEDSRPVCSDGAARH